MIYSLAIDVKQLDDATCRAQGITSYQLMERAAATAAREIIRLYPYRDTRMMILAGPGNNGGDALVIVRLLYEAGYPVTAYLYDPQSHLSDDCGEAATHVPRGVLNHIDARRELPELTADDVIIDGLLGSGLNRPLEGGYAYLVQWINQSPARVVSIDIPTGLNMARFIPEETPAVVIADHTLTFGHPKLSFYQPECADFLGRWQVLDIGLEPVTPDLTLISPYRRLRREVVAPLLRPRSRFSHKGTFGHAALISGSRGMMGATVLAARACLRAGVGLLTIYGPQCGYGILQTAVPEAKYTPVGTDTLAPFTLPDGLNALGLGPGLGQSPDATRMMLELLPRVTRPMVLDADALNLLAAHPDWWKLIPPGTLLTPHPKEADRLLTSAYQAGYLHGAISASPDAMRRHTASCFRMERMRALAREAHLVIILKGAYTSVILPDGRQWLNTEHGHAGMAVGGTGDTLTGILLALLAAQYPPAEAALIGVYLHSSAADLALEGQAEESWLPSDLIGCLGRAYLELRQ
jgi:NAD(P)H-hydrate epimerase